MRTIERVARVVAVLALAGVVASCGFANGAGVPHLVYEDDVALCRFCAQKDQICVERQNGSLGCSEFSEVSWCNAAQNLFFAYEEDGPYATHERGAREWSEGLRRDCETGRNAYVVEALFYDPDGDVAFEDDWELEFDGETINGLEVKDLVYIVDANQVQYAPTRWDAQVFPSNTGADTAYAVEFTFCLGFELDAPVALQVTDEAGHHSNPVCFAAP
jgi:hypothetical protein